MSIQDLANAARGVEAATEIAVSAKRFADDQSIKANAAIAAVTKAKLAIVEASAAAGSGNTTTFASKISEAFAANSDVHKITSDMLFAPSPTSNDNRDMVTQEWVECRHSIDRFDKLLVDLRKVGLGALTAIATAATLLTVRGGFLVSPENEAGSVKSIAENVKFSIFLIIVLLALVLYYLDHAHQAFLKAAVARATQLEEKLGFEITTKISEGSASFRMGRSSFFIYGIVLLASNFAFWVVQGLQFPLEIDWYAIVLFALSFIGLISIRQLAQN